MLNLYLSYYQWFDSIYISNLQKANILITTLASWWWIEDMSIYRNNKELTMQAKEKFTAEGILN